MATVGNVTATTGVGVPVQINLLSNSTTTGVTTVTLVAAPSNGTVTIQGGTAAYTPAPFTFGQDSFSFQVSDTVGSAVGTCTVNVLAPTWTPPDAPKVAKVPILIYDENGVRTAIIHNPRSCILTTEVNGAQELDFTVPKNHPKAALLVNERQAEVAGEIYRIRRVESSRDSGVPILAVHGEALWYDLDFGTVNEMEFNASQAGPAMVYALSGTDWTVGTVTVSTSRSWTMQQGSPLECLRAIASTHGGDLVFDNKAKTVSLLTFSGHDNGIAFWYGKGISESKKVIDTTSLVTRIRPVTEDGVGIESVNNGNPYVTNFSYTSEDRWTTYTYAAGTSPYMMLAMASMVIANRGVPDISYEFTVADMSAWSGQQADRFACGDLAWAIDLELGISIQDRIVRVEYDVIRPWASNVSLSSTLRELGSSDSSQDAALLDTGAGIDTRNLVPFNLLQNARFDNGLSHWASSGATVVQAGVTGLNSVLFTGAGTRWVEQTVATDTRDQYMLSVQVDSSGFPDGTIPDLTATVRITYDDGTTEDVALTLA